MRNLVGITFIFIGISLLVLSIVVFWKRNEPGRLQFNEAGDMALDSAEPAVPAGITIESIDLKLPIIPTGRQGGIKNVALSWETTSEGVSYLSSSPRPGEPGNSILYGHNWGSILGNLYKVRPGQVIEIYYSDGTVRSFEVASVEEVTPDDTSVLEASEEPRITLYTCSGLLDEKRLVVSAVLI